MSGPPTTVQRTYALHGITVRSGIALHAPTVERPPQIVVRCEPFELTAAADAAIILHGSYPDGAAVTITREKDGFLIDHSGLYWFHVSDDYSVIRAWAKSDEAWSWIPILLEGWVLSFIFEMQGRCILHASAVGVGDGAIAFSGDSGAGKSTMAMMLASDGSPFLSDDVTVIDPNTKPPTLYRGSLGARLRQSSVGLVELGHASTESTVDGRLSAVNTGPTARDRWPLRAILIPVPTRQADDPSVNWLHPRLALVALAEYPRVGPWRINDPVSDRFKALSTIVEQVPVGDLVVPWGPPWTDDGTRRTARRIRELVDERTA
jgi:hypothetical protein